MNEALALSSLHSLASVYVPVCVPWDITSMLPLLRMQPGSAYHSSAVAAAAIDTATLCTRMLPGGGLLVAVYTAVYDMHSRISMPVPELHVPLCQASCSPTCTLTSVYLVRVLQECEQICCLQA